MQRDGLVPLSVCGELASDPVVFGLLIGFGVREFSMTPSALPAARQVVDASSSAELKLLARDAVYVAISGAWRLTSVASARCSAESATEPVRKR